MVSDCLVQITKYQNSIESLLNQLKDAEESKTNDTKQDLKLVLTELFDTVDVISEQTPKDFASNFLPSFIIILENIEPNFNKSNIDHEVRHTVLEILTKSSPYLINSNTAPEIVDASQPAENENGINTGENKQAATPTLKTDNMAIAPEMVEPLFLCLLNKVLMRDNEVNGVLALRYINTLFKYLKFYLTKQVADFLNNFLYPMYKNSIELINTSFSSEADGDSDLLTMSLKSFKVLAECPVSVVSIFSSFKSIIPTETVKYLPLVMNFLQAEVEHQKVARENFESNQKKKVREVMHIDPSATLTETQRYQVEKKIERYCTIAPAILNMNKRETFCDFIQAQIKCASFLVYIFLRNYLPELLQQQAPKVPQVLCRLLQDLPSDLTHLRKELLQTIRHIFSTPYKKLFLPYLPVLLNEDVLLSQGFTNNDTLRTLALSNVADLVHNLRSSLTLDQIETSIFLFIGYLHDTTLQANVHIMSAKLLINLVERLVAHGKENTQDAPRARKLLICIIEGYVTRLKLLNQSRESILYYQDLYSKRKQRKYDELPARLKENDREEFISKVLFKGMEDKFENQPTEKENHANFNTETNDYSSNPITLDSHTDVDMDQPSTFAGLHLDRFDIKDHAPILTSTNTTYTNIINLTNREKMRENDPASLLYGAPIKDALYLYRTLLPFLKSVIGDLRQFNPPPDDYTENHKTWYNLARVFTLEEVKLLKTLFHETLKGFLFFTNRTESEKEKNKANKSKYFDIRSPNLPLAVSRESRDLMESFVVIFMHLDIPTFTEIVESEMEFFYQCILEDSAILHVAQSFLTGEVTSPAFNSILLRFLGTKLPLLGDSDVNVSNILIRLYKLSFMSVNVFPAKNEPVLLKKINSLILDSLEYSTKTHEPLAYFYLIRTLFRCIGGGKLEHLYLALIPVLNTLLNTLNSLIIQTKRPYSKNLYVEICLTIPVKLVVLAPLFPSLVMPLCISLQCHEQTDLIQQGLRTLELCVDTFNADYLDPLIEPSADELFKALFGLLKPIPANPQNSHTAVRILGKLGGRNRKFLKPATDLNSNNKYPEVLAKVEIYGLKNENSISLNQNAVESGPLGVSGWNESLIKKDVDIIMKNDPSVDSGVLFPIASCVEDALSLFYDPGCETDYRLHAFSYLMAVLKVIIASGNENFIGDEELLQKVSKSLEIINENDLKGNTLDYNTESLKSLSKSESLIVDLLDALFFASSIPELGEKSLLFLLNLADHFSICYLSEKVELYLIEENTYKMETLDPPKRNTSTVFIKSLINSLGSYNSETRKTAVKVTERLFVTNELLLNSQGIKNEGLLNNLLLIPMFKEFIHGTTNEEFYIKCGSVLGLYSLIKHFSTSEYICVLIKKYQIAIVSAMFFVLEDTKEECSGVIVTRATEIISKILTLNMTKLNVEDLKENKPLLHSLSEVICYLNSPTKATRDASKSILSLISLKSELSIETLMEHCKSLLLNPIFSKPLRALPIPIIIGNIDAVTYCLQKSNDTSFNDKLLRFLTEVIALVDADDNSLAGSNKPADYVISKQLVDLRVTCINLLSACVSNPEIAASNNGQTKLSILNLFFKTMTRDSDEIIEATYLGLKSAITSSTYKLPKEVLQPGLKPLLINLSDRENLSPFRLKALTRVLEILNSHFKLEVGKKLLDHLDWKSNTINLDVMADQDIREQQPTIILTHIINMFHLLPNQADIFLRDLVIKVMRLENKLRCNLDSPFRKPLALFLNRFFSSAAEYMTKNLSHRVWVSFICSICQLPEADNLYKELKNKLTSYVEVFQKAIESTPDRCVSFYASTVDLINTVYKMEGATWLEENADLAKTLLSITVNVNHIVKTSGFYFDHTQLNLANLTFQQLFIDLINISPLPKKTELFFELLKGLFDANAPLDPLIKEFIFSNVVDNRTAEKETRIEFLSASTKYIVENMENNLSLFLAENIVKDTLVFEGTSTKSLKALLPIGEGAESLKNSWIECLANNVWSNETLVESNIIQSNLDFIKFQFINITACIVKWAPETSTLYKTEVIKFGWNFVKMKDELCKQASFMLFAMFIPIFDVSSKVVTPLFVALLRNEQTEGRFLISQTLDMMVPVMHQRYVDGKDADEWLTWVKWIRRVLSEEKSFQNLMIYHLLCGFPDQFFSVRELFVPNIINYLGKLFKRQSSALLENQNLAMDLLELLISWEEKHNSYKQNNDDNKMDVEEEYNAVDLIQPESSDLLTSNSFNLSNSYEVSYSLRETCVSALIKYLCSASARNSDILINLKGLEILSKILSKEFWSDVRPSLDYYEKTLIFSNPPVENVISYIINYLQVFEIVLEQRPADWIVENITYLSTLLQSCINSDHQDIQRGAQKVLKIILKAIVQTKALELETVESSNDIEDEDDNMAEDTTVVKPCTLFLNNIVDIVTKKLNAQSSSVAAGITLTWTLFINIPLKIDGIISNLLTVFGRLVNDHLQFNQLNEPKNLEDSKITLKLIEYCFFILCDKVAILNDQRRIFLSLVATLIDKSNDVHILKQILRMFRYWAFSGETYPSVKEVSAILTRMLSLELKGEHELTDDYFKLILSIFENRSKLNSDFPIRMEHPFLVGTKISNSELRSKFMKMLDESIEVDIHERLYYIIKDQNWEFVADSPWLNQAIQLFYGSFNTEASISLGQASSFPSLAKFKLLSTESPAAAIAVPDTLRKLIQNEQNFVNQDLRVYSPALTTSLSQIFYKRPSAIRPAWVDIFPIAYKSIKANEIYGMNRSLVALLSKDYHVRQSRSPMNVIGALLESFKNLDNIDIPPHLLKYLAITHNAWYEALSLLEGSLENGKLDNGKIQETTEDAILELYSTLSEKDMFYGLWRRRATYSETIAALSYEQIGLYDKAQLLYESAQVKTRANALPYLESEYSLWEDGWIYCAQELQQWEILTDIAHDEAYTDLMVECAWRTANWSVDRPSIESSLKGLLEVPTPRRQLLETFVAIQRQFKFHDNDQEVKKLIEDGVQISLAKWETLPKRVSNAHIPLLHLFQEFTEMTELQMIYKPLFETNQSNIDQKSSEIKRVLSNWRERVPNCWDDLNIWNDLITWRTHVFDNINETYLPLLNLLPKGTKNIPNYYYKGYHEVAWVINRFAKVARIQEASEVCLDQLNKIYSLPNIEIHEAFLKLMEQAKCYYEKPEELNTGIEVIGNTNLTYFSDTQKSEFITMQGMFLSKKNDNEKANESFVQAIKLDMKLAKAWAEWGHYHDKLFTENKANINHASSALSCYLQAAGLYNNKNSKKMISRILWFISLKDDNNTIQKTFENSKTEIPTWYWITFIPQLLTALSQKEGKMARSILIQIVKEYPQAVHFHLRTAREEYLNLEQQVESMRHREEQEKKSGEDVNNPTSVVSEVEKSDETAEKKVDATELSSKAQLGSAVSASIRQPWDYLTELSRVLKTSYPLLALTLEFFSDQITSSKKVVTSDETFYRVITTLLNEAHSTYQRLPEYNDNVQLPEKIVANIFKQCNNTLEDGLKLKLVVDFVQTKPTFEAYIKRLRIWKNKIKSKLGRFAKNEKFEEVFPYLSRFHQKKYEDIEIPGQYLLNKDTNKYFVKIGRFLSEVTFIIRGNQSYRVIHIRGQNGSLHSFAIETPSSRYSRREERVIQVFRLFNDALNENVQTRKRNITFTAPVTVPFSPDVRLIKYSKDHLTLQDIFEKYCDENGMDKNVIYDYYIKQLQAANNKDLPKPDLVAAKVEILASIQSMFMSKDILKNFFKGVYKDFESFWLFRKNFTVKYSCLCFMVYMLSIGNRTPGKIHIDLNSGDVFSLEFIPNKISLERLPDNYKNNLPKLPGDTPIFQVNENVPFRLTPNLQRLIGDIGLEGIFSTTMLMLCRAVLKSDNEMKYYLNLLIKDEVVSWYAQQNSKVILNDDLKLINVVLLNTELIVRKLVALSHFSSQFAASNHFVLDAISSAVAPRNLASLDITAMPYF